MNFECEKEKTCCIFGHREIENVEIITLKVSSIVEELIKNKGVATFLFGSKSRFNDLCLKIVTELKIKYPHIKRIYVRAEYNEISDEYKDYLMQQYEDTYYPDGLENAGKAVYVERNREMINKSKFAICYYNENYTPFKKKSNSNSIMPTNPRRKSGTRIAYDYAVKKELTLYNVCRI